MDVRSIVLRRIASIWKNQHRGRVTAASCGHDVVVEPLLKDSYAGLVFVVSLRRYRLAQVPCDNG